MRCITYRELKSMNAYRQCIYFAESSEKKSEKASKKSDVKHAEASEKHAKTNNKDDTKVHVEKCLDI